MRPCGLMDKASDFGSEDCRFESCQGRVNPLFFSSTFDSPLLLTASRILLQAAALRCLYFTSFHITRLYSNTATATFNFTGAAFNESCSLLSTSIAKPSTYLPKKILNIWSTHLALTNNLGKNERKNDL